MPDKLDYEDYNEPKCPACNDTYVRNEDRPIYRVPMDRVTQKLDEYFFGRDFEGAERHLSYWLAEARAGRDKGAELSLIGEFMGFYRQRGRRDEAYAKAEEGLRLAEEYGYGGSLTGGTICLNAATVYKAFGDAEKAVGLYDNAREVYETYLEKGDRRLGGLYNNMGLALTDCGRYGEAEECYKKAIEVMESAPDGGLEAAISCLNMADEITLRLGEIESESEVEALLGKAKDLLEKENSRTDGYYAYVCESCASVYGYYGYFLYEKELRERAKKIYERA